MTCGATDFWTLAVIVGLAGVTVLTRCFFFILDRPWGLPEWAHRALHYAPVAALAAVIVPEIVMTQGHLIVDLAGRAALCRRWPAPPTTSGAAACCGTMLAGMAVYLPLHLGLGW